MSEFYSDRDESQSIVVINQALENGVNFLIPQIYTVHLLTRYYSAKLLPLTSGVTETGS